MKTNFSSLLVDDMRTLKNITKTCRNYQNACMAVLQYDFDVLYLDHDLGEHNTGYDFMKYCIGRDIRFKYVVVVSSNPVGRDAIGFMLKASGYKQKNPYTFFLTKSQDSV